MGARAFLYILHREMCWRMTMNLVSMSLVTVSRNMHVLPLPVGASMATTPYLRLPGDLWPAPYLPCQETSAAL